MNAGAVLAVANGSSARARRRSRKRSAVTGTGPDCVAASYARYSSDQQREESIADQERKCQEKAEELGVRILPEFAYRDEAVSGTKLKRQGLDAMLRDAEAGEFQVLFFHSLSRLSRESVITMPMLKQLVYTWKVRIVSVTEGVDSARDGWDVIAAIMSLLHERYIKELSGNVFRGQEGAVLAGYSVGDYRFGYRSEPVPGSEQTRKGKHAKPRMVYVVDEVTAPWVLRIFDWFVKERRSLGWITRELNRRRAPKDHRSTSNLWHHQLVAGLLSSPKYIGVWPWAEMQNTRDPLSGKIQQEPRSEEECEEWTRELPDLKIVEEEVYAEAQRLLEDNYQRHVATRRSNGELNGSRAGSTGPRHLLSGLIKCGECGSTFHVGGAHGRYLFCPGYRKGVCSCKTQLRRDRAERLILDQVGQRILQDPAWFRAVYEETRMAWRAQEDRVPEALAAAERERNAVEQKIARLVDRIENGLDDPSVTERLQQHRQRRRELSKQVDQQRRLSERSGPEPTEAWVAERLNELGESLQSAEPAASYALRELVGGAIVVTEIRREGRSRHQLRGEFRITSDAVCSSIIKPGPSETGDAGTPSLAEDVVIDFIDPNPIDAKAAEARHLYDQGLPNKEIAIALDCTRSQVTKLIRHSFALAGEEMPDGRQRRALTRQDDPPRCRQIAGEVKRMADDGLLFSEIAERQGCDRNTVTKAWAYWHESRGLAVPDGRQRRKDLERKQRPREVERTGE